MKFNFKLEEIKYAKILYKDNNETPCITKVAVKSIKEREILTCARFENGLNIELPQVVTISIVCNDGLYRTKTKLKSIDSERPYIFFILETPQGIEYEQNREYFRVPVDYKCIYKLRINNDIKEIEAQAIDISANGMSIFLSNNVISEISDITIFINNRPIQAQIRYVRSEKIDNGYKISFAYTKITETDRDYISQVCLQKQLEQRRNSIK